MVCGKYPANSAKRLNRGRWACDSEVYVIEEKWNDSEKKLAHQIFDIALKRELNLRLQVIKEKAKEATQFEDLWDIEEYLQKSRKEIDNKFDFRYSQLLLVFAVLLREGKIGIEELNGLGQSKIDKIRTIANI
jgi:hypothetical protein